MGILKLMDFLKKKHPSVLQSRSASEFSGKILAVDTPSTIYQFLVKTMSKQIGILSILCEQTKWDKHPCR